MRNQNFDNFDLESYLHRYSPVVTQPNEWVIQCPSCGKLKLVVNVAKKMWHCWVCEDYRADETGRIRPVRGAGGLISLVELLEGCSREHAISLVSSRTTYQHVPISIINAGINSALVGQPRQSIELQWPEGWQPIVNYNMFPYLQYRGISQEDVNLFGLGFCAYGTYAGRLIFPVFEKNQLVYYQARAMWDDSRPGFKKSLNPPRSAGSLGPTEVLMNLDTARRYPRVALVEGPVDCVHAGPSAVATFGKKLSMTQALKLKRAGVKAIDLMWDGPSEREVFGARFEMLRAATLLTAIFSDVRLVFLPRGDPGDYTRAELDSFRVRGVSAASVSRLAMI